MQGFIDFDGTLSGNITGGGGGGSEVTITPTLQNGTKIADYTIDETTGELYAPTPPSVPDHIVTDIYGFNYTPYPSTEVARYTIDNGEEQSIRTPDFKTEWEAYPGVEQDYTIGILRCYGSNYNIKIPNYQKPLTAGTGIDIDPDNVISASGGNLNYSLTEQNTGRKWIDGKDIYQLTISIPTYSSNDFTITLGSYNIDQVVDLVSTARAYYTYDGGIHWDDRRFVGNYVTQGSGYNLIYRIEGDHDNPLNLRCISQGFIVSRLSSYHTVYYTKNV